MNRMEYNYVICSSPDDDIFIRQCKSLEKHLPIAHKLKPLEDVDGSVSKIIY